MLHILAQKEYKPGDKAPDGYLAWHEWADTQHKAGLRQKECGRCGKWKYPQELSGRIDECVMQSRKGPVTVKTLVCNKCTEPATTFDGTVKPVRAGVYEVRTPESVGTVYSRWNGSYWCEYSHIPNWVASSNIKSGQLYEAKSFKWRGYTQPMGDAA